jgi:hypothetical protein
MPEAFSKTRTYQFGCNLAKRHPGLTLDVLEKGQLDDVTRIKLALRNQGRLAPLACYLVFKVGNFAVNITEII